MNFDELVQLQVLKRKAVLEGAHPGSRLLDAVLDAHDGPEIRQLCAKVTSTLYMRVERSCEALDLTKRQFVEWAVMDAVQRAERSLALHFGDDGPDLSPGLHEIEEVS